MRDSFTDFIGTQHRLINNDTEETEPQGQNGEAQNLAIYRYEIYQAYLVFNMASVQNIILSSIKTKLEKLILTFCDQRRSSTYTGYITFVNILSNIVKVSISEKYTWINGTRWTSIPFKLSVLTPEVIFIQQKHKTFFKVNRTYKNVQKPTKKDWDKLSWFYSVYFQSTAETIDNISWYPCIGLLKELKSSYDKLRLLRVDRKSSAGDIAAKFKYGKVELLKFLEKIDENRNCQEDSNLKNDNSVRYVNMETHQKRDHMNDSINQLLIRVLIQSELGLQSKAHLVTTSTSSYPLFFRTRSQRLDHVLQFVQGLSRQEQCCGFYIEL